MVIAALVVYLASTALLGAFSPKNKIKAELGPAYVATDSKPLYDVGKVEKMFGLYRRPDHFAAHIRFIYYDLVYPLCYGLPLVLLLAYFYPAQPPGGARQWGWLVLLPLLAMLLDYAENFTMLSVVKAAEAGPEVPLATLKASRTFTGLKWLTLILSLIIFLGFAACAQARLRELVERCPPLK